MSVLYFIIGLLLVLPLAAWRAYVTTVLWGWFITPTFGVQSPSIWVLAGFATLVMLYQKWNVKPYIDPDKSMAEQVWLSIIGDALLPAMALLSGWIYHLLAGGV